MFRLQDGDPRHELAVSVDAPSRQGVKVAGMIDIEPMPVWLLVVLYVGTLLVGFIAGRVVK